MKFFHLSDLHIGLKLMNRDFREDQEYILAEIIRLAVRERPDAVVIAGDIYDRAVPSADAVEIFDGFVAGLAEALPETVVMMISGNHDSGPRLDCFRSVLARQHVHMIGTPPQKEGEYIEKVTLEDAYGPVNFYLLPFVKPSMVKRIVGVDENGNNLSYDAALRCLIGREEIDRQQRNVLVSHQFYLSAGMKAEEMDKLRTDSEIRTVGNVDQVGAVVLELFDYGALGHIHKPMSVGRENWRYCGTPLAYSVSEAGQQKAVTMVEMGAKGDVRLSVLPLEPLRQVRVIRGELSDVLTQQCGDYVTVILTDQRDLDVADMRDRLRDAFPYLLEIRRETVRRADYGGLPPAQKPQDPFELCCLFLGETDEADRTILRDVINIVKGGEDR